MSFVLTPGQDSALKYISDWLSLTIDKSDPITYLCTLCGNAGTGKTTLTKLIVKKARRQGNQVLCCAPTHKAKKVLSNIINTCAVIRIPMATVAGLLGKQRKHGYIGTNNYGKEVSDKLAMYDLIIVDEISMVSTTDYKDIITLAKTYGKKVLMIGDDAQIPNPGQGMVKKVDEDGVTYLQKATNPAFKLGNIQRLTQITRNKSENPLLDIYDSVRSNMGKGYMLADLAKPKLNNIVVSDGQSLGYTITDDVEMFNKIMTMECSLEYFRSGQNKIVTYTNHSVALYNKHVRKALGYKEKLVVGDVLMGYENVGPNNDLIIENGQEYKIAKIITTEQHAIVANGKSYEQLYGYLLHLEQLNTTNMPPVVVFTPELEDDSNYEIIMDLVELANKVNRRGSTKQDFIKYIGLKSQMVFFEPVYHYKGKNFTELEFKQAHPMLSGSTDDYIQEKSASSSRHILPGELTDKLCSMYPDILTKRAHDNKEITGSENLLDMYQVIGKDIDYGYSITSHKSQASTYATVYIDENSFNVLKNSWSVKYNCRISRMLERDQLKYVAISRARFKVHILSNNSNNSK